jgi:acyl carrier protein
VTRDEILHGISAVLYETAAVEPADVTEEKSFAADLEVDSLLMVEVAVVLEDRFEVSLSQDELGGARLVSDMVTLLEKKWR